MLQLRLVHGADAFDINQRFRALTSGFCLIFNRAYTRFDNPAEIDELMPEDE